MNREDPHVFIQKFPEARILVVGDVMLDEYIEGDAERISPEAPIPVLRQRFVRHTLGGAGNVAANVAGLGGRVTLVSVVGSDSHAKILARLSRAQRISAKFIVDKTRPTTVKRRFVSGHHQLVRMDIEETERINKAVEDRIVRTIRALSKHDIVIVSDYAKGCVTPGIMKALKARFGASAIIADMKPSNAPLFAGILAITPNVKEAAALTNLAATDALAERAARTLSTRLKTSVVLTRGEKGISVCEKGKRTCSHFHNTAQTVRDVTGAGDSLVAALALMLAAGAPLLLSAKVANVAAGIVVGKAGTATLLRRELLEQVARHFG